MLINYVLAVTLAGCGCEGTIDPSTASTVSAVAAQIRPLLTTGSLICTQGDCLAVRVYTASRFTHVASTVVEGNEIWVYDATGGAGVRRQLLDQYLSSQSPGRIRVLTPRRGLTDREAQCYRSFLEGQLGRPYDVAHHLTGRRGEALHCSEYAVEALAAIDFVTVSNPARVSPASLIQGVSEGGVFLTAVDVDVTPDLVPVDLDEGCCSRWWKATTGCCRTTGRKLSGWILCR